MKMLFTGCVQCGRSTTSVQGICPECDELRSTGGSPRPRERLQLRRRSLRPTSRND